MSSFFKALKQAERDWAPGEPAPRRRAANRLEPRWTPQNRPYVDGAKPAIGDSAQARVL